MNQKIMFALVLLFLIMSAVCSWAPDGDEIEENTDYINIQNIETEWTNYSDGFYGYYVEFEINNLSTSHEILSVISFYDINGSLIKNENLSGGIDEEISHGKVEDNLTIILEDYQKSYFQFPSKIYGKIERLDYCEVDRIKIDIIDASENKLLFSVNHTFNMSNIWKSDDVIADTKAESKTDSDYEFFKDSDDNGDNLIDFNEFSQLNYIFTEDTFWQDYSIEEILQSEWDNANSDGDDYLTFEEFKSVI